MTIQILILIAGLALIVLGADVLVNGSSSIARKIGISEFVIGLTIVGMGTSAPEMVVSFMSAANGNADISIGNVIGSNIMNTLLIAGLTAIILPIGISSTNRKVDIPLNIFIVLFLFILGMNQSLFGCGENRLSRIDGVIMLTIFAIYMYRSFVAGKQSEQEDSTEEKAVYSIGKSIFLVVAGLFALVFGGRIFVNSATNVAHMLGVSDKFIALTIIAGGTSMPELATCIVAAIKKKGALALGNVIGSNIFNVLFILGGSALIRPLSFASINYVDFGVLMLSALLLLISAKTNKNNKIDRFDGALFLLCEALYMGWLIYTL